MTNYIVKLSRAQQHQQPFSHPVLDEAEPLGLDETAALLDQFLTTGDAHVRDQLIMGHLNIVGWLVRRYMAHWHDTRRFADDMVSVGMLSVINAIDKAEVTCPKTLSGTIVLMVKQDIENFLNDSRYEINASLRTNYRRLKAGLQPESVATDGLEDHSGLAIHDEGVEIVDIMDLFESLQTADKEEMMDSVLYMLENHHEILEHDLSDEDRAIIEHFVRMGV